MSCTPWCRRSATKGSTCIPGPSTSRMPPNCAANGPSGGSTPTGTSSRPCSEGPSRCPSWTAVPCSANSAGSTLPISTPPGSGPARYGFTFSGHLPVLPFMARARPERGHDGSLSSRALTLMLIYAVDLGTTNIKVALYDARLERLAAATQPVAYTGVSPIVEFDPDLLLDQVVTLI